MSYSVDKIISLDNWRESSLSGKLSWLECAKMSILHVAAMLTAFGCSTTASITKQQDSFYFDPAPINQDVLEGEPVKLRCDVSNRKMIYFYWTLNGRQLTNTSRRFQEDSDLRILWVDRHHDNGSLRCIATNVSTGIALRSAEAKLNVLCKFVQFFCVRHYVITEWYMIEIQLDSNKVLS